MYERFEKRYLIFMNDFHVFPIIRSKVEHLLNGKKILVSTIQIVVTQQNQVNFRELIAN